MMRRSRRRSKPDRRLARHLRLSVVRPRPAIGVFLDEFPASFDLRFQDPVAGVDFGRMKEGLLAPRRLGALFGLHARRRSSACRITNALARPPRSGTPQCSGRERRLAYAFGCTGVRPGGMGFPAFSRDDRLLRRSLHGRSAGPRKQLAPPLPAALRRDEKGRLRPVFQVSVRLLLDHPVGFRHPRAQMSQFEQRSGSGRFRPPCRLPPSLRRRSRRRRRRASAQARFPASPQGTAPCPAGSILYSTVTRIGP